MPFDLLKAGAEQQACAQGDVFEIPESSNEDTGIWLTEVFDRLSYLLQHASTQQSCLRRIEMACHNGCRGATFF